MTSALTKTTVWNENKVDIGQGRPIEGAVGQGHLTGGAAGQGRPIKGEAGQSRPTGGCRPALLQQTVQNTPRATRPWLSMAFPEP